jgi:hypothetical protein
MRAISLIGIFCVFIQLLHVGSARLDRQIRRVHTGSSNGWKPEDLINEQYNKLKAPPNGTTIHLSLNITQIVGVNEADEVSHRISAKKAVFAYFCYSLSTELPNQVHRYSNMDR